MVKDKESETFKEKAIKLGVCFVGLQVSYITWGVMQETVTTTTYNPTPLVPSGKFPSATFLVFANRILAIAIAAVLCLYRHGTLQSGAPFWYFSPCSMSNVLSSYGQYAALKYVAFPLQVLFKSAKLIPVMLMGTFLSGTTYSTTEYLEALVIAFGVAVFSLSKSSKHAESAHSEADQMYGIFLLVMYVTCDAFTNQWQSKIKKDYRGGVDSYQMMFAVNTFSILFTMSYLLTSGEWWLASDFMAHNPTACSHILVNAVTSATGQLFIFYTVLKFGPVVLTIIMNTRQMMSMIVSCILFDHPLSMGSYLGTAIVFGMIGLRSYRSYSKHVTKQST
mmetsp:Transcript_101677/g.291404  ORF Transcript_101677/g.291404 Transcript_101677/m.291404 type:complete len:335 (+) Transcript_101677:146-1150(+)